MAIHTNPYYPPETRMAGQDIFGYKAPVTGYKAKGAMGTHKVERDPWPGRPETETTIQDDTFEALVKGTGKGKPVEDSFSFWDFLDVINPLHHLPIVGAIYRYFSGDEIKGASRIAGGTLYGGPIGMAWGAVNTAIAQVEGEDIGGVAMAHLFGQPEGKARPEPHIMLAEHDAPHTPIPVTRFPLEKIPQMRVALQEESFIQDDVPSTDMARVSTNIPTEEKSPVVLVEKDKKTPQQAVVDGSVIEKAITGKDAPKDAAQTAWDVFYTHQENLKKNDIDDFHRSLAKDTYERQLLLEAERVAMAERNARLSVRRKEHETRQEQIDNLKYLQDLARQQAAAEAAKRYEERDEHGFRPTAGMYSTRQSY